jgi:hypothetical protein
VFDIKKKSQRSRGFTEKKNKNKNSVFLRVSPPCPSVVLFVLLTAPVFLYPQTAERIERLLETSAVSYEDAASFVLEAADLLDAPTPAEALSYAVDRGWLPRGGAVSGRARLDGVSLLIMRSFNIRGGLFYSAARNSHYAYRELVYLNVIQGRNDPAMAVSGDLLLFMINRVLSYKEANQL